MKKFTSLVLVLALSLALCIPALAAGAVPTISLRDGEVGDRWETDDFVIEIIDAEDFYSAARSGYILQNELYTSEVNSSFRWNCGTDPVLEVYIDNALSETAVEYNFDASPIATIGDTVKPGTAKSWRITSKRTDIQSISVSYSFKPVSSGDMQVWLTVKERA